MLMGDMDGCREYLEGDPSYKLNKYTNIDLSNYTKSLRGSTDGAHQAYVLQDAQGDSETPMVVISGPSLIEAAIDGHIQRVNIDPLWSDRWNYDTESSMYVIYERDMSCSVSDLQSAIANFADEDYEEDPYEAFNECVTKFHEVVVKVDHKNKTISATLGF